MSRNLLLVLGNAAEARTVLKLLFASRDEPFTVEWVSQCSDAVHQLKGQLGAGIAAVIVDPVLPDSPFIETIDTLIADSAHVPILVLCRSQDEDSAQLAVRKGAHDYLLKNRLDERSLYRALNNMLERSARTEVLFAENERNRTTLESIGDAVISTDLASNITYLNPIAERMTGWTRTEALGRPLQDVMRIIDGESREEGINPMAMAIRRNEAVGLGANSLLVRRDGHECSIEDTAAPIYDRSGAMAGAVIVFRNVSVARAMSLRMSYLAQHDFLTELPNRLLLNDRMKQAMAAARRHSTSLAVLFVDVDHFKLVNDALGHTIGDALLRSIARRLVAAVRTSDTVSRRGGDEFVVLLSEVAHATDAGITADKILAALAAPHRIEQQDVRSNVSIGIGVYPNHGTDAETLVRNADLALLQAKATGGNRREFFDSGARGKGRQVWDW